MQCCWLYSIVAWERGYNGLSYHWLHPSPHPFLLPSPGLLLAVVCYHQYYPSPLSANCDSPHPTLDTTPTLPVSNSRTNLKRTKYPGHTPDKCSDHEQFIL